MATADEGAWSVVYIGLGVVLFVVGLGVAAQVDGSGVTYATVEGISVFAVLYLIAQAVERVTEWLIELLSLANKSPEKRKQTKLAELRTADSTLNGNPTIADFAAVTAGPAELVNTVRASTAVAEAAATAKEGAEKAVAEARRDIAFLARGLSTVLAAVAVTATDYSLLKQVGVSGVDEWLDRVITTLAVSGGTTALHELIGRLQKAKEADDKKTATAT